MELAAAPRLRLAVDGHALVVEEITYLSTRVDEVGELQQLPEPDHVAANCDLPRLHAG